MKNEILTILFITGIVTGVIAVFCVSVKEKACAANLSSNFSEWKRVAFGEQEVRSNQIYRQHFDVFVPGGFAPLRVYCGCDPRDTCEVIPQRR